MEWCTHEIIANKTATLQICTCVRNILVLMPPLILRDNEEVGFQQESLSQSEIVQGIVIRTAQNPWESNRAQICDFK